MKVRYEGNMLLVDFNSRGWNGEEVVEMNDEQFSRFKEVCESDYDGFENMELGNLVDVIITMSVDGDLG